MSGTHRDLFFWSISRCFASKNHTWGLGPMETSISDVRHAVLHAENHRWGLGPSETCYSGPEVAVLHAKTTGGVYSPADTCNSSPKVAVLHPKTTHEGWDPWRFEILVQNALYCIKKHRWGLGQIETRKSDANNAVLHSQSERSCLGPIETCFSGP